MKTYPLYVAIAVVIAGCTKVGTYIAPNQIANQSYTPAPQIKVTALAPDYFGQSIKTESSADMISIPCATNVIFECSELSGKIKNAQWLIDKTAVGNGNKVVASVAALGTKELTINYTDSTTGNKYIKKLQLRPFRHVYAKLNLIARDSVCGKIQLFASKGQQTAVIDCTTGKTIINNYVFLMTDYSSPVFVGYVKNDIYPRLLLLLDPGNCDNFSPGIYKVGEDTITIVQ